MILHRLTTDNVVVCFSICEGIMEAGRLKGQHITHEVQSSTSVEFACVFRLRLQP